MTVYPLLDIADRDGRALATAVGSDLQCPVPHCPDWDGAALVRHTGVVLAWMHSVVSNKARVSRRSLPAAPDSDDDLVAWYLRRLDETMHTLGGAPGDAPVWTFSSLADQRVAWWWRRVAVELAIHRWDAQHAVAAHRNGSQPAPLDATVAYAGIDEFVTEFLPGLLAAVDSVELHGVVQLQATDSPARWHLDLDAGTAQRRPHGDHGGDAADADGQTQVAGTLSQLLLWLTNRCPRAELTIVGDDRALTEWPRLRR